MVIWELASKRETSSYTPESQNLRGRKRWIYEFEARLAYVASSSLVSVIQLDPVSREKKKKLQKGPQQPPHIISPQTGMLHGT